jgi:hypothetical protein
VLGRLLLVLLGALAVTLLGPLVPSHRPNVHLLATGEEYIAQLVPCSVVALLLALGAGYEYIAKPLRNRQLGHQLVGRFVVQGKQRLLGSAWLELPPDDTHRVGVSEAVFASIRVGDMVEVVYSATADLVRLHRINTPAARS